MDAATAILELGVIVLLAAALAWVARRLGLPSLVGLLAAGVMVSPPTPRPAVSHSQLELVADLGVLLLLFEFSAWRSTSGGCGGAACCPSRRSRCC